MSKDIKDTLKNNTPEFLKAYPDLVSFLEVAGEFLNETKKEITDFDYSHDYEKSSRYALDQRLNSVGFEIPPYISSKVSRTVLRDALQAFIRKGTTDSLLWVLKIIGTTPTIRQAWLPSPNEVRDGKKINLNTGETERYDISKFTYTDFLYGDAVTTDDGTFLKGYKYNDPFEEDPLENIPIIGENYEKTPTYLTPVEKMPYVIVRISDQNFNVATEPYVDPETGETYEYGLTEEYRAVENLIEYFLYDTTRPASVRVIVVSSIQELDDKFKVKDTYDEGWAHDPISESQLFGFSDTASDSFTHEPTEENDVFGLDDEVVESNWEHSPTSEFDTISATDTDDQSLTTIVNSFSIGDPILINFDSPYESQFQTIQADTIDGNGGSYPNTLWNGGFLNKASFAYTIYLRDGGFSNKVPMRVFTTIDITAPTETIEVYGLNHYSDAIGNGVLIGTVNSGSNNTINVTEEFHGIYFKTISGNDLDLNIAVNYN